MLPLSCSVGSGVVSWQVEAGDESERKKQLKEFFEMIAIQLNEEGLVVKDLSSPYLVRTKYNPRIYIYIYISHFAFRRHDVGVETREGIFLPRGEAIVQKTPCTTRCSLWPSS